MSEEEKTCKTCMYDKERIDTPCYCCVDHDLWVKNPWAMIERLEEELEEVKDELELWKIESYLTYKPSITTAGICYNAESKLCAKCKQPECDLAGWVKKV